MKRGVALAAAALAAFIVPKSEAQPSRGVESVTIESQNALPGIWRFPPHPRRSVWTEHGSDVVADFTAIGPEKYCRIGGTSGDYVLNCLELAEREPRARLTGSGRVELSWAVLFGVPGCRWTYYGRLESGIAMSGHLGMRCGLVYREDRTAMTLTKLVLSEKTPDAGGEAPYLRHLFEQMATGRVSEPVAAPHIISSDPNVVPLPQDAQEKLLLPPTPEALRLLGPVTAVVYVGAYTPIVGWDYQQSTPVYSAKRASIYAVEFENGERLCALRRRADGALDLFQCV